MSRWPHKKKRFHKDTYPGLQWNKGDFILWHGCKDGDAYYWDTKIGRAGLMEHSGPEHDQSILPWDPLIYCGGIDNLYVITITQGNPRISETLPMAKFWLHCIIYMWTAEDVEKQGQCGIYDTLLRQGYRVAEIRFFLMYGYYRDRINYSEQSMSRAAKNSERSEI